MLTRSLEPKKAASRSALASTIQVKATPANNRFKNMMPVKPESQRATESFDELIPPSSVGPFVPSTGKRPALRELYNRSPSPVADAINDTPIKTSAKPSFIRRPLNEPSAYPPSSPVAQRKAASEDLVITDSVGKPPRSRYDAPEIMETPIKKTAQQRIDLYATPEGKAQESKKKSASIFERLGWDDDFDDL